MGRSAMVLLVLLAASGPASGPGRPGRLRLELAPNFNTCSVYAFVAGDDGAAKVTLRYRAGGRREFRAGQPLTHTGNGRYAGSIFGLRANEPLVVEVTCKIVRPGAALRRQYVASAATRTRSEAFPAGSSRSYYVSPDGSDRDDGSRAKPFATIQHAADLAEPGDTINLLPGSYRQSATIRRSGRPGAYITLRAAPGPAGATARPTLAMRPTVKIRGDQFVGIDWQAHAKGVFVAPEGRRVGTVVSSGRRLYHHSTLGGLLAAEGPLAAGWWHDRAARKLYIRPPGGRPPIDAAVGVLEVGLRFRDCAYWIVQGVELYLFGGGSGSKGIEIANAHHIVVRGCRFQYMRTGVAIRGARSQYCLVERSVFQDDSIWDWPWKACKGHDVEGAAVSLAGGQGNVVRHNVISGTFNGIVASTWGDLANEDLNRDLDIHHNTLTYIGDDALEPEGACMNVRFWNNATSHTLQGISLAPITVGPVYVVRDRYVNFKGGAVKVSNDTRGPVFLYHVLGWTYRPRTNAMQVSGPWDNMHFRNCIFRATRYAIEDFHPHPRGCSFEYCCLFSTDKQFVKWSDKRYWNLTELAGAEGFGKGLLRVEPYTRRPEDVKLAGHVASELIDAGVVLPGINDDFRGKAPDIGPQEFK